jgi:hypothetical protein
VRTRKSPSTLEVDIGLPSDLAARVAAVVNRNEGSVIIASSQARAISRRATAMNTPTTATEIIIVRR